MTAKGGSIGVNGLETLFGCRIYFSGVLPENRWLWVVVGPELPFENPAAQAQGLLGSTHSPGIVRQWEVFFLLWDELPTETESEIVANLLPAPLTTSFLCDHDQKTLLIAPRQGTISPWSSCATDLGRQCGLIHLHRLERARLIKVPTIDLEAQDEGKVYQVHYYDRMLETVIAEDEALTDFFFDPEPARLIRSIPMLADGKTALEQANSELGLGLNAAELQYLLDYFQPLERDPTDIELMMFAQIHSEHCRHKIFNSQWKIDGTSQPKTLFDMIRHTYACHPEGVVSAYSDNSAVLSAFARQQWQRLDGAYMSLNVRQDMSIKVETHNHPTGVSPYPGAATGVGGEIRDEVATGRGGRSKAGLCGYMVSHLQIPEWHLPWECNPFLAQPTHLATSLEIMLQAPLGAARFANEYGRPTLLGFFRTMEGEHQGHVFGYRKPLMLAGGWGSLDARWPIKENPQPGDLIVVLGGPGMRIGLGGSAASSRSSSEDTQSLDYASVQRGNPEMQRRVQEVVEACIAGNNPIISIHDVGAGGLSNAVPELIGIKGLGADVYLDAIPVAETGMSALEIWCNEAQERYVLAISESSFSELQRLSARESCPLALIGRFNGHGRLLITQSADSPDCMIADWPMEALLKPLPPPCVSVDQHRFLPGAPLEPVALMEAAEQLLRFPAVASKAFLITICDRSVGGLVVRDPMVGPWQIPVADMALTLADFQGWEGEAAAMGERPAIAILSPAASARMAVGEAITNISAAPVASLKDIRLSANWMADFSADEQKYALFEAVQAMAEELCPVLGLCIPVGKDSLSMSAEWNEGCFKRHVGSPVTVVVSAFAPVEDVRPALTPVLNLDEGPSVLLLIDLGAGQCRMGGSALAQCQGSWEQVSPDVDKPQLLADFFYLMQELKAREHILAYHDRSDGGLYITLCEMAFAARAGFHVNITALHPVPARALFCEELGAVIQVREKDLLKILSICEDRGLGTITHILGKVYAEHHPMRFYHGNHCVLKGDRIHWQRLWGETSYRIKSLRDDPICAREEFDALLDSGDNGLSAAHVPFEIVPAIVGCRPKIAIVREQGTHGHMEMAAAFSKAGFEPIDMPMQHLFENPEQIKSFCGLALCGGFSFGDVLGAGRGWAVRILHHEPLRSAMEAFFRDQAHFVLGVCNGCQVLAHLAPLIPGAEAWPEFRSNRSRRFESRLVLTEVCSAQSPLLQGMEGARLPVIVSHGEGRAEFSGDARQREHAPIALRYVNARGEVTQHYPDNPNGSQDGIAGICNGDGRIIAMMPHPERLIRTANHSWHPSGWGEEGPWMQMFYNARRFVQ